MKSQNITTLLHKAKTAFSIPVQNRLLAGANKNGEIALLGSFALSCCAGTQDV